LKKQLKDNDPIIKMKDQSISKLENENENLVNFIIEKKNKKKKKKKKF